MWYIRDIINMDGDSVKHLVVDDAFGEPCEELYMLELFNPDTVTKVKFALNEVLRKEITTVKKLINYISSKINNEPFIGYTNYSLFALCQEEYELMDYFDVDKEVSRVTANHAWYGASNEPDNLFLINYNLGTYTVTDLLLTTPEVFVFEDDAFYYELTDFNLALRYTYVGCKGDFIKKLIKLRLKRA